MDDAISSVMFLVLHSQGHASDDEDLNVAVSTDGTLQVVGRESNLATLRQAFYQHVEVVEDESEFRNVANALAKEIASEACELRREIVGYVASTRSSVVRISMGRVGQPAAQTISFDVEEDGGRLRVSAIREAEAYDAADVSDSGTPGQEYGGIGAANPVIWTPTTVPRSPWSRKKS